MKNFTHVTRRGVSAIFTLLLLLSAGLTMGQVTVNPGAGSYSSLNAAFAAINAGTHQGNVVITVTGSITEPTAITPLLASGGTSNYTSVTISPSGNAVINGSTSTALRGVIEFQGADNVTIDGDDPATPGERNLTIQRPASTTAQLAVIRFASFNSSSNGADNNTVKNCIIYGSRSTATSTVINYGIYSGTAGIGSVSATGSSFNNDNINIENNEIGRSYYGIYSNGTSATSAGGSDNWTISNNYFGNAIAGINSIGYRAIHVVNVLDYTISGNKIENLNSSASQSGTNSACGIFLGTSVNINILNNELIGIASITSSGYGIRGITISNATAASNTVIANNFISDVWNYQDATIANYVTAGIAIEGTSGGIKIYHNSINLYGSHAGYSFNSSGGAAAALYVSTSGTNLDVRNNIFSNSYENSTSPADKSYAIYSSAPASSFSVIDNNNYFVSSTGGSTPVLGFIGSIDRTTLAALAAGFGGNTNSQDVNPGFTSNTDLHIPAGSTSSLESAGVAAGITAITSDIDGDLRPGPTGSVNGGATAPDLGADEFDGVMISPPAISNVQITPSGSLCVATSRTITATIVANAASMTSVVLSYTMNGAPQPSINMVNTTGNTWSGTIPATTSDVSWSIAATNSSGLSDNYAGTTYQDNPLANATASITASANPLCAGASTILTAQFNEPGNIVLGAGSTNSSTSGSSFLPGGWGGTKTQYLIRASELSAMGLTAGNITAIGFEPTTSGQNYTGFSLSIGHTSLNTLALPMSATGLSEVYTGTGVNNGFTPVANTVNTLSFGTGGSAPSFNWDGTSNVLLSFCWSSDPTASNATGTTMKVDAPGFTCTVYGRKDNTLPAAFCMMTTSSEFGSSSTGSNRPRFTITGNSGPAISSISWSNGSTVIGTTNPITVSPSVNTTYTATITSAGCTFTPSPTIAINVAITPSAPSANSSIECSRPVVPNAYVTSTSGQPSPVFNWYDAPTGGNLLQSGNSATYTTSISQTTTFYVSEASGGICESPRVAVTATLPSLVSNPANNLICSAGGSVELTGPSIPGATYSWTGANLDCNNCQVVHASPSVTTSYTLTVTAPGGCVSTFTVNVGVISGASVVPTATPDVTCFPGGATTVTLNSNLSAGNFGVAPIPYSAATLPGSGVTTLASAGTAIVPLGGGTLDDGGWAGIPLGFDFNFFGSNFSTIAAGTNGLLMFGTVPGFGTGTGQLGQFNFNTTGGVFPNASNPGNVIALIAADLYFNAGSTPPAVNPGIIRYWNEGSAPTRRFIIEYFNAPNYNSGANSGGTSTVQCILYETTGVVEIHITNASGIQGTNANTRKTIGLQDGTKTLGAVAPGRQLFSTPITTPEAWRFSPPSAYTYLWSPAAGLSSTTTSSTNYTVTGPGTFTYNLAVTNPATGCITTSPVVFEVLNTPPAPVVSGTTSVCGLATTTLNTNAPSGSNIIEWFDVATGGNAIHSGTTFTTPELNASKTYYVQETSTACAGPRTAVNVTWTAAPSLAIFNTTNNTTGNVSFCGTTSVTVVNLDANSASAPSWSANGSTYSWSQSVPGGLSCVGTCAATNSVNLNNILPANNNEHIEVTVSNPVNGCIAVASMDVTAFDFPGFNAVATPSTICSGDSSVITTGLSATAFGVGPIPYAPSASPASPGLLTVGGTAITSLTSGSLDDGGWGAVPIGFNFNFFGNIYSTINVGTNGVLQFGTYNSTQIADYDFPTGIPSTGTPPNIIAVLAADYDWDDTGTISYWTEGFAPNRVFVLSYEGGVGFLNGEYTQGSMTVQCLMYETTGVVEVHLTNASITAGPDDDWEQSYTKTIGLQDATQTIGSTAPNRNAYMPVITTPEAWRFSPPINYTFSWTSQPAGFTSTLGSVTVSPSVNTQYNVVVTDPVTGCVKSDSVTVVVNPLPVVAVSPENTNVCYPGGTPATLTASGDAITYDWTPQAGLDVYTGNTVNALPVSTTVYTVTGTSSNGCTASADVIVSVTQAPVLTIASTPAVICEGEDAQLSATAVIPGYTMNTNCTTGFIDISSSGTTVPGTLSDDSEHNITIPSFTFNGVSYTSARIGMNGVIAFGSTSGEVSTANANLPSTANSAGNIFLAPYWDDLDVNLAQASIRTQTIGSNFIIQFTDVDHNSYSTSNGTGTITFQVQLNLASGAITFLYPDVEFGGTANLDAGITATVGIQFSGTSALLYSFNAANLSNGQCISFIPNAPSITYDWSANSTFLNSTTIANPIAQGVTSTQVYSLTILDQGSGCSQTQTYTLNVNPLPDPAASSNSPVCEGQDIFLTSATGNVSYSWSGPGFSSSQEDPVLSGATLAATGTYSVTATDANGCVGTSTTAVTVNANPVMDLTITPVSCDGFNDGSVQISVNNGDQFGFYFISDEIGNFDFVNPTTFTGYSAGTYNYLVQDGNACFSSDVFTIPTVPNAAPVIVCPSDISVSASPGVCGAAVTYATPVGTDVCPIAGTTQTAGLPSGAVFPVGTTVNTFVVTDASGLTSTCSFSVTVTDDLAPVASNCPVSFSACNPVSWTAPTFADNCPGVQVVSSHTPGTVFPLGTTTVTYTATDVYNNVATCSFDVTVLPPAVGGDSITTDRDFANICAGESITLTVNGGTQGYQGQWKWYSGSCGGTLVASGTTSITVSPSATTTYYARIEGFCNTTACVQKTVTVSTGAPTGNVSYVNLPTYGAPGVIDTLYCTPVPGATYYQWSTNNGQINGVLFNGQTGPVQTSIPQVQITFVLPQSNYQIRLIAGNACGRTNQANDHIRGTVGAPTSLTGPTQVCPLQTASYTVSAVPSAGSYQWSLIPASAGTITGTGLTRSVTFAAGFTSAQLCVAGVSNFGLVGPAYCISIATNSPAPGAISGNSQPCQGSTLSYTIVPVAGATSYQWSTTVPGAVITGTGTTGTITYPSTSFTGTVCVRAVSTCGVSTPSCMNITSGIAGVPGPISGPVQGICNASNVNYALSTSDAVSYSWVLPSGATVASGGTTNSVNVNFGPSFTSGTITCIATYACGTASTSITVDGAPTTPVVTPATICPGGDAVYFASSTGATTYNWTITGADYDECTNPPSCSQYYIIWGPAGGSFSVTAQNSCGTSASFDLSTNCRMAASESQIDSRVYPNPTSGMVTVEFTSESTTTYEIRITDLQGRNMLVEKITSQAGLNRHDVDLTSANKGTYMLFLKDQSGKIKVDRIVVQ